MNAQEEFINLLLTERRGVLPYFYQVSPSYHLLEKAFKHRDIIELERLRGLGGNLKFILVIDKV